MEARVQKQIIDYFSFFEEFYNTSKTCLKTCQNCAVSINKLIKRCRNIQEAQIVGTPLEPFTGLQTKLSASLHNLIQEDIAEIQKQLSVLETTFDKLCNKHKVLTESCKEIDFKIATPLIRGTPLQPPLKQLLEFAEDSLSYGGQICAQIDTSLRILGFKGLNTESQKTKSKTLNMDLLGSILNSMEKPPSASEAQKVAIRKQKEAMERNQKQERNMHNKFRKCVEEKVTNFIKDGTKPHLLFEPMDQTYRAIVRDVAELSGVLVFSFGQEGIDRYPIVYLKERPPSEDELSVRRNGGVWNEAKAAEMAKNRELEKQAALDTDENNRKRKHGKEELSGTFYKQKYAHLIGETAAIGAAHKTNANKSYGEVPSENKKDQRSIEQTMADIRAKKIKRAEIEKESWEDKE